VTQEREVDRLGQQANRAALDRLATGLGIT